MDLTWVLIAAGACGDAVAASRQSPEDFWRSAPNVWREWALGGGYGDGDGDGDGGGFGDGFGGGYGDGGGGGGYGGGGGCGGGVDGVDGGGFGGGYGYGGGGGYGSGDGAAIVRLVIAGQVIEGREHARRVIADWAARQRAADG